MREKLNAWRVSAAIRTANFILGTFAPTYAAKVDKLIMYGMDSLARDTKENLDPPPPWEVVEDG